MSSPSLFSWIQSFLLYDKKYSTLIDDISEKNLPITSLPHHSSVKYLFAICFTARRKRDERKGDAEDGKGDEAGEDSYEGEEGGGGPCSDVGATAVLWRGTTGPIDTAAGGGCHDRASGIARENGGCKVAVGGCAGTTAGKTVGRWGCGNGRSTMVREREKNESEGTGQRWRRMGCRGGGSRRATPAPTTDAPPVADGATIAGILFV